jgi:hypothetical protein
MVNLFDFCKERKEWKTLEKSEYNDTHGHYMAYIIAWRESANRGKIIGRIGKKDKMGILYIGKQTGEHEGKQGSHRLKNFYLTFIGEIKKNSAALKLRKYLPKVKACDLYFKYYDCKRSQTQSTIEHDWLVDYCKVCGEPPPLNSQLP